MSLPKREHKRQQFNMDEDLKLAYLVKQFGENKWELISQYMKGRNIRQLKERWEYYLSPDINKSPWTDEEDRLLIKLYREIGSKWKIISSAFKNRTHISVRNRMKTLLKQKKENDETPEEISFCLNENEENIHNLVDKTSNDPNDIIEMDLSIPYDPYFDILEGMPLSETQKEEF